MQAILFIGIQATGKSSFYQARFADTHVRINLDMLKTRNREARLLEFCCETQQPFVVDNTNPTRVDRLRYISSAKEAGMLLIGYYFESSIEPALDRNADRGEDRQVPERGVRGTHARLEIPDKDEGFDELYYVRISGGDFEVEAWRP